MGDALSFFVQKQNFYALQLDFLVHFVYNVKKMRVIYPA